MAGLLPKINSLLVTKLPTFSNRTYISSNRFTNFLKSSELIKAPVRHGGGHGGKTMIIKASTHQWHGFWDQFHFYLMLGVVPGGLLIWISSLVIGPAELTDIPEGYEPRHYEYYRHPIERVLARLPYTNEQMNYEKNMYALNQEKKYIDLKRDENRFEELQRITGDWRGWYFVPSNPSGVIKSSNEKRLDEEIGSTISR